jgi:hypothetical protein
MAPRLRSAVVRFDALPEPVLRVIVLALPVDARARAACVCRSWRAFLADPSLWLQLDLTEAGGVAAVRVTENLVRGAVARAAGNLRVLSLDDEDLLVKVIGSDGAQLQQVNTGISLSVARLAASLAAAPRLQVLNADVRGCCTELLPVLRHDPPYRPLRIRFLEVAYEGAPPVDVLALAAAVAAYEPLKDLGVVKMEFARGLNALVDAAAERRVSCLALVRCRMDDETVPALARLLLRGSLDRLIVSCDGLPTQEARMLELCAALRACHMLEDLKLSLNPLGGANCRVVTELLDAAASLPALSELNLRASIVQDTVAFGHALGALLRANLPSLRRLGVSCCELGDEGLAPLLDGLAANTHLRELDCKDNDASEAFERDRLTPALAAQAARGALDE